ncbi:MAG: M67 family metallopeptidase [Gemmatimonadetes bacterium]|nr:M67 family metallopeptidase [Gemmatimonadota bacterium]
MATSPGGGRMIRLERRALEEMRRQARSAYPRECCGALLGRADGDERTVLRAVGAANTDAEPRRGYRIGPEVVRRLEAEADAAGLVVLGFYHSHPDHPAVPSARDRENAWPWYTYLIVPVSAAGAEMPRGWRFDEGVAEEPVEVVGA